MGKYRICSACGKKNPIDEALCSCNNLLMSSPIEEDGSETEFPTVIDNTVSGVSQQTRKYKKCPSCGYLNIPSLEFCQQCGDSMDDVFDLVEAPLDTDKDNPKTECKQSPFHFVSQEGFKITLPIGNSMIGREGLMGTNIVQFNRMYVSATHLLVSCSEQSLVITDVSRNGTFVNSNQIPKGQPVSVAFGDIIGLGGVSPELDKYGYYFTIV